MLSNLLEGEFLVLCGNRGSRNAQERKFTPRIKDKGESKPPVALGWNSQTQPSVNLQVAEAGRDTRNCCLSCNEGVNYRGMKRR